MRVKRKRGMFILIVLMLLVAAQPISGVVIIEKATGPLVEKKRAEMVGQAHAAAKGLAKVTEPACFWRIPFFKVDTTDRLGTTTFFSMRNEGGAGNEVEVLVFQDYPHVRVREDYILDTHEIRSVNVREYLEALEVDEDGHARGWIRIHSRLFAEGCAPISVDVFQVDFAQNFATGALAYPRPDWLASEEYRCSGWQARFLKFPGSDRGSVIKIWVQFPLGGDRGDLPTVYGDVYSETGSFINSFTIRTDQNSFEVHPLDYVNGSSSFGSVDLEMEWVWAEDLQPQDSIVMVEHSAHGRFSIGSNAVCTDSYIGVFD